MLSTILIVLLILTFEKDNEDENEKDYFASDLCR